MNIRIVKQGFTRGSSGKNPLALWETSSLEGLVGKESACNSGDFGSILGREDLLESGKGCPFQCSGLENALDCIIHGFESTHD